MIKSIGVDMTEVGRVARLLDRYAGRFADRVFTAGEQAYCDSVASRAESYAVRFAAKEAVMKLLGTGNAHGVRFVDVEVVRNSEGQPSIVLHRVAQETARKQGIQNIHLSLTHTATQALAFCVAESGGENS